MQEHSSQIEAPIPPKEFLLAWALSNFLGALGFDRLYLGYRWSALFKFLTFGGLGIWALIDVLRILTGNLRSKDGQQLNNLDTYKWFRYIVLTLNILVLLYFLFSASGLRSSVKSGQMEVSLSQNEVTREAAAIDLGNRVYRDEGKLECDRVTNYDKAGKASSAVKCERIHDQIFGTDESPTAAATRAYDLLAAMGWQSVNDKATVLQKIALDAQDGRLEGSGGNFTKGDMQAYMKLASQGISRLSNYSFCDFLCESAKSNKYDLYVQISVTLERSEQVR